MLGSLGGVERRITCWVFPSSNSAWSGSSTGIGASSPGDALETGDGCVGKSMYILTAFRTRKEYKKSISRRL